MKGIFGMKLKKISKIISITLLVMALVVCLVPFGASAANGVSYGTSTSYGQTGTFEDAITFANSQASDVTTYIRLNEVITLSAPAIIGSGRNVVIDLYGKTVTLASEKTGGLFEVVGNLTIEDSSANKTGKITGAKGDSAVKLSGNGTFILKSGEICGNDGGAYAGGVHVANGTTFRMEGGKIDNNNTTSGKGGGVYVDGNVWIGGNAAIVSNFAGGEIKYGTASKGENGVLSNLCLGAEKIINVNKDTIKGAKVGVSSVTAPTAQTPVTLIPANANNFASYFTSDNDSYGLINVVAGTGTAKTYTLQLQDRSINIGSFTGGPLYYRGNSSNKIKAEVTTTGFVDLSKITLKWCDSEGKELTTAAGVPNYTASALNGGKFNLEFYPNNSTRGGTYYYKLEIAGFKSELQSVQVASTSITRGSGTTATTTYYYSLAEAVYSAINGDTIKILDSHTVDSAVNLAGKAINVTASSKVTLALKQGIYINNGSLTVTGASSSSNIVFAGEAENVKTFSLIKASGADSIVNLKNVTLTDGWNLNGCGGLSLESGAKAELTNVLFDDCRSQQGYGGAIYVGASSSLTMTSARIVDCSAVQGGAIYVATGAKAKLTSSNITKCSATGTSTATAGGAIYNVGETEIISTTISECKSAGNGGAIYHEGASLVVKSSSNITSCKAEGNGGAVYVASGKKLVVNEVTFSDCSAVKGEGVYLENGGVVSAHGRVVMDEIYMTSAYDRIEITNQLSSDSYLSVYTTSHQNGRIAVSAGEYVMKETDAKRIHLSGAVKNYSLQYENSNNEAYVTLSTKNVSVGALAGGTLKRGVAITSTAIPYYHCTTGAVENGVTPVITWYKDKYMRASGSSYAPSGISFEIGKVDNGSFDIKIKSGTPSKAGEFYFTVTAGGVESGLNTLSIARSQVKKPTSTKVYTYNGSEQSLVLNNFNSAIMSFVSGNKAKDTGYYSAVIQITDKTQYEWEDGTDADITVNWMIERATLTIPTITTDCVYKGAEQSPVINNFVESAMTVTGNKQTKVGEYRLTISIKDTKNYMWKNNTIGSIDLSWKIKKAELVIKANDVNLVYGDAPKNNGVTYTTLLGSDTAASFGGTLTYTQNYTQGSDAGTYKITPSGLTSENYDIKFQDGKVIVDKKPVELVWSNTSFTYDGQAHIPSVAYKSYTGTQKLAVQGSQVKAGKHTATATGFEHKNYKLANPTVEFEIKKVELTVKANNAIITYGDELTSINPGVVITGFISGENESVLGGTVTYNTNYVLYGDVGGSFTVTPAGLTSDNYSFKYVNGNLSVKKRVVKVAADDIYSADGNDKMTYKVTEGSFVNGDEQYLTLTRAEGTEPGKYAINGTLANGNYEFSFTAGNYYILRYSVAVKGNNHGITLEAVDGIDPEIAATITPAELKDYRKIDTEGRVLTVYKIVFEKNGSAVDPEGKIKITIPFDEKYAEDELIIKRIDANGTATALHTKVVGNTLEAEVANMDADSAYAIYTYTSNAWIWLVVGGVALVLIGGGVGLYIFVTKKNASSDDEENEEDEE